MDANVLEGGGLTPQAAVAEIRRIEGLHGALARRASGLTWMIWGIVAPAIFISYALLSILVGFPGMVTGTTLSGSCSLSSGCPGPPSVSLPPPRSGAPSAS